MTTRMVLRGHSRGHVSRRPGMIRWVPQLAVGITGTPVESASRATPVRAVMGHRSGSRVRPPSG